MLTRPLVAGVVLLACYLFLSAFMDPEGYLGTDTGAKVYTLEVMDRVGTADPDVGYWAEDLDEDGSVHPLYQARPREDGGWVAVTTLPMLELARPLYALGGYRVALLLPMLGSVGAAFAARAVATRVGASQDEGWLVFWVIGLGSPALVYALDFWEHSIGLACMVGAVALLVDDREEGSSRRALAAGLLLGFAAVLRNETFVYALVAVGAVTLSQLVSRRSLTRPVLTGVAAGAGFAGAWFANVALERVVDAPTRASRATGTVTGTATRVGDDTGERVREALLTLFGLRGASYQTSILLGIVVVGILLVAFRAEKAGDVRVTRLALVAASLAYFVKASGGLGFIPGLFLAFPLAIAGILHLRQRGRSRLVVAIALISLPIVYAFQYLGGAAPQWGGRYTLTSAVLLGSVGVVGLWRAFPETGRGLVALSVGVSFLGVAWLGVRSHGAASFFDQVEAHAEEVVISRNAFLIREGGDAVVGRRWLSARGESGFSEAIEVARDAGERRFSVLEWGSIEPPDDSITAGLQEIERWQLHFVDVPVALVSYRFVDT